MATDARELVRTWPGLSGLGADACVTHPAWRMPVQLGARRGSLFAAPTVEFPGDAISLALALDGEPHVLRIADSPLLPDLHLLWTKRANLPPEIVLALVERECGDLFQLLEKTFRRQLGVSGRADGARTPTHAFRLETEAGALSFAMDLSPELLASLGRLDCLDPTHESIRALTRPTWVSYGSLVVTDAECARLAPGCCIVPQGDLRALAKWVVEPPTDEAVSVLSAEPVPVAFAAFADGALPEIPPPARVALYRRSQAFATAVVSRLGDAEVLRVEEAKCGRGTRGAGQERT